MTRQRLAALAASLGCAAAGASLPTAGCNGGTTPVCTYDDGAIDPEAGCGTPVEAGPLYPDSAEDAPEDQQAPVGEDAGGDALPVGVDASDGSMDAADAHVVDANEDAHDAHIADAHADARD